MSIEISLKTRRVITGGFLGLVLVTGACSSDDEPSADVETEEVATIAQEFYGTVTSTCKAGEWPLDTLEFKPEQTTRPANEEEKKEFTEKAGKEMSSVACNNAAIDTITRLLAAGLIDRVDVPIITQSITIKVGCDITDGCLPVYQVEEESWSKPVPEPKEK